MVHNHLHRTCFAAKSRFIALTSELTVESYSCEKYLNKSAKRTHSLSNVNYLLFHWNDKFEITGILKITIVHYRYSML